MSNAELLDHLNELPRVRVRSASSSDDSYVITLDFDFCTGDTLYSRVDIYPVANVTEMNLRSIEYTCPTVNGDRHQQVLQIFEREVTARFNPEVFAPEALPSPSVKAMPMLNSSPEQR